MSNRFTLRIWPIGLVVLGTVIIVGAQQPVTLVSPALTLGHGTAATALEVELPTDGTGVVKLGCSYGGNGIGDVNVANGLATATINGPRQCRACGDSASRLKSGGTAAMTGTTSRSVIAGTASNYLYIYSCSVNNTHASVDTLVDLQDGSGGTVL